MRSGAKLAAVLVAKIVVGVVLCGCLVAEGAEGLPIQEAARDGEPAPIGRWSTRRRIVSRSASAMGASRGDVTDRGLRTDAERSRVNVTTPSSGRCSRRRGKSGR